MECVKENKIELIFGELLIKWYNVNKRDLPWRNTVNPYEIWISEIILQQTRVAQGYNYYVRFIESYPTIEHLAHASEQDVLKMWEGLGYYSRARNLHFTAQKINGEYGGIFPKDYKTILSLKGIGEYTAAAIVSFAYNDPYAVVDGNVYRVLSRVFAIEYPIDTTKGKQSFVQLAQMLITHHEPRLYNQAIMEFGALQCTPISPNCSSCCLSNICLGAINNQVSSYPKKIGKIKSRNRYLNYFDIRYQDFLYINQRIDKDIWQNMYEYPMIETDTRLDIDSLLFDPRFLELFKDTSIVHIESPVMIKHILSHQNIYASFYQVHISSPLKREYLEINRVALNDYPMSKLMHRYLDQI